MWLGLFALLLVIAAIAATILSGGIFTVILIPLAVIAVVAAVVSGRAHRSDRNKPSEQRARRRSRGEAPLPHSAPADSGSHPPATPEQLVDARRGST